MPAIPKIRFDLIDEDGEEVSHELPAKYVVCDRCRGTGTHDHPAFSNGLTCQDFDEDPDFREEYMRGTYDVPCEVCHGRRVVLVADEDCLDFEQAAAWERRKAALSEEAQERKHSNFLASHGIEY